METISRNEASSMTPEEGESKSKWLADAKRFNAQKLRLRMKEQKLRFQSTPQADKENNANNNHSRPQLSIAVSMSEDAEDPITPRESPFVNIQAMMEGGSLDFGNASAWAMMENYDMGSKRSTPDKLSESTIIQDASTFWDKSFTADPQSMQFSPDSRSVATPSTITRATTNQPIYVAYNEEHLPSPDKGPDMEQWKNSEQLTYENETGPTPAKLRRHWIREKENDSHSQSPHVSLLQESLILSDNAAHDINTTIHTIPSAASEDDDSMTQISNVAHPPSSAPTLVVQSKDNRDDHGRSLALVIRPPKDEQNNADDLRLKERVQELEHALRATVATPRGTILQENPIKTLLDRNQTLVKEVRFADSTCVELSGKVSALEAEKKILRERVLSLEDENKELRRDFSQAMMETASMARSTNDDRLSVASVVRIGQDEEGILRQVVDELKAEVAAWAHEQTTPVASSTSTLLSDIDMNFSSNDLDAPHTLAKALQAQVELIKEQKQITKQADGLKRDLLLMEARNAELENQLAKERSQVVTPVDQSIMLDLSRAQEESNFLGRQLGNVQDKLDHVREELEEERKKSMSIDSVWRSETALHLRTIRSLEAKLETASQSLAMTSHNSMNGHYSSGIDIHVMTVEQDILNAKATLMTFKKDLEAILSKEVYDPKWMPASDGDTQLVSLVATFLSRMRKQYGTLNFHVEKTIAQFCDRLEHLTETVGFLRSSLLFESASVSTATSPVHPPGDVTSLASSPSKSRDNGELEFQEDDDDEDDMYSRMEEAREQCPSQSRHLEDVSTDFDDLSRLLSDDSTLDSILKSGAHEKSTSDYENLRKPLESAIRECQRVRERSVALKEELNSEKIAFAQLESENRRLVREYSQKEEERQLVREALDEAKTKIQQLEALLEQEKMKNEEKLMLLESRCENLETEKVHLEEWLSDSTTKKEEALDHMASVQSDLDDVRDELRMTQSSLAETEEAFANLKTRFGQVEGRAFEAEDLVLESRVSQEDMRKERALLKAQMAKLESQAKLLRENLDRVTSQSKKQFDDMSQTIDGLRAQQEESREILRRLVSVYRDICDQFDKSEYVNVSSLGDGADGQFGINWTLLEQLAPFVASMLTDTNARQSELGVLRGELERVQKDLTLSTDLGTQYKSQVEQEKAQNQKLFELLQQAEIEMERSASQIRELSAALTKQQQQETDVLSKTRATEQERDALRSDLADLRRELSADLRQSKQKINELTHELSGKRKTEEEMRSAIDSLESKGTRLRQYVKKLTIKCEEWEMSYERQSKSLEKLQLKNIRMKEKVYEMAAKYKDLYGRVKSKNRAQSESREKWAGERSDLQQIHAKLEKELETITNELAAIDN